jgi:hypothetical protein
MLLKVHFLVLLSLCSFAAARAQVEPPPYSGLVIEADGDPAGAQITLQVTVDEDLDPIIAGFDIYRIVLEQCHDSELRITTEPLPRGAVGNHEFILTDPGADEENVVYIYWVKVVDASRTILEHAWFDYDQRLAFASWGDWPVVGIGELVDQGSWAPTLLPCEGTCYRHYFVEGDGLSPYVDSGQVVKLYGSIYCNFEGCFASVHTALPAVCPSVPSPMHSWGTLKAGFR